MIRTKIIGRLPQNYGDYDSSKTYGKKQRCFLYGCEWESKMEGNTYAPATLNTTTGVITPDTAHWTHCSGSYNDWLIDNGYKKVDAGNVKDGDNTQHDINGTVSDKIESLEAAVGTGGSVDSRIADAKSEIKGNATSVCDTLGKAEALILAEASRAQEAEEDRYTKSETYTKTEVNGLVDTPHQEYVTVDAYANLPATGGKDTIYRVSNYNGSTSQVDASVYSEYAWDGSQYVFLCVKSQIGEVFDISVYNNNAKYADLAAALNGGANIPQSLQKGGMSVKFVQSSDNKYVQYRNMNQNWSTTVSDWQGADEAPIIASNDIIKSKGVFNALGGNNGAASAINGFIRRIEGTGEKCLYHPSSWIEDYNNCTLELCFKNIGFTHTQFLLTWAADENGTDLSGFIISENTLATYLKGANFVFSNVSSLGNTIRISIKKSGTNYTFFVNGKQFNTTIKDAVPRNTDIYLGSYINYLAGACTDYYYAKLTNDDTGETVELINAGSEFVELTSERHALGKVFKSVGTGSDLTDGDTILTGNITLDTTVSLPANTHIRGNQCVVTVGANGKLIVGDGCSISGIRFNGGWNNPRTKTQLPSPQYAFDPIVTENDLSDLDNYVGDPVVQLAGTGASVYDCIFEDINRTAILCYDTNAYTLPHQASIVNNQFANCKCGIVYHSEFATISANRIWGCLIGVYAMSGNLSFVNNKILMNDVGIAITDAGNGGHSEYTGIEIAHCGLHGIYCYRIDKTQGVTFCGIQVFDAGIKLLDTSGFMLIGSRFGTWMEVLWSGHEEYPTGIIGNMVHSNYVTRGYADTNNKPLFYYPDGALDLKLNLGNYDVPSSEINN